ncbi:MAG: carbamoyltransferase HypF [Deltaproteobacteria bacterium]|nr:carbamoyltransferase HypF [Deltaproteobacteria bacterium]
MNVSVRRRYVVRGIVQGVGFRPFVYRLAKSLGIHGFIRNDVRGVDLEVETEVEAKVRADVRAEVRGEVRADVDVVVEAQTRANERLDIMVRRLVAEAPPLAEISDIELIETQTTSTPTHAPDFRIVPSTHGGPREAVVAPDATVCGPCLDELFDASDRRFRYPLINCTNCGPRFSIVIDIPYDRPLTTMAGFTMCAACDHEYHDPLSRRFHAQPNACPVCGPKVRLLDARGEPVTSASASSTKASSTNASHADASHANASYANASYANASYANASPPDVDVEDPIEICRTLLARGAIVGVKGIGGYHIVCDADNEEAVLRIRERKRRPDKPFALLFENLETASRRVHVDEHEAGLLTSPARPIVLLRRREPTRYPEAIAPGCTEYGVMLAYTPIHHLLLRDGFDALVATSANVTHEPIAFDDRELVSQLGHIVDYFLVHDRPIHTRVDDSIVRSVEVSGRRAAFMLRRARGHTPRPIRVRRASPPILALGAELKNTICVTKGSRLFLSQHIGDLKHIKNYEFFLELVEQMPRILDVVPEVIAHDLHPEFRNTKWAMSLPDLRNVQLIPVQHHHAHMAAVIGEHKIQGPVIGVTFDGMGYGLDGTAWGGEFLYGTCDRFERRAHFRGIGLPGGDRAVHEPFRIGCAVLTDAFGPDILEDCPLPMLKRIPDETRRVLARMIERGFQVPTTSSVGRLFDAVAAILDVRDRITYEGQAAIQLEALTGSSATASSKHCAFAADSMIPFPFSIAHTPTSDALEIDHRPMIRALVEASLAGAPRALLAERFHITLAEIVRVLCVQIARDVGGETNTVVLSGGVFLNQNLLRRCHQALERHKLRVVFHEQIPSNDGGISFGQALVASARLAP